MGAREARNHTVAGSILHRRDGFLDPLPDGKGGADTSVEAGIGATALEECSVGEQAQFADARDWVASCDRVKRGVDARTRQPDRSPSRGRPGPLQLRRQRILPLVVSDQREVPSFTCRVGSPESATGTDLPTLSLGRRSPRRGRNRPLLRSLPLV